MSSAQNVVGVMTYMTKSTAATNVSFTGNLKNDPKQTGFDNILNGLAKTAKDTSSSKDMKKETLETSKKPEDTQVKVTDKKPVKIKKEEPVKQNETNGMDADKELQNAIEEDGKKLIEEIAEMMNVSEDEINAVLQMIGLTPGELLNPENIIQVVNVLNANDDGMNLIVDADLYSSLKDILGDAQQMQSELTEEFGIPLEKLQNVIKNKTLNEDAPKIIDTVVLAAKENELTEDLNKPEIEIKPETNSIFETENETVSLEQTSQTDSGQNKKGSDGNLSKNDAPVNLFNQMINNIADAAGKLEGANAVSYADRAQMEEIVRQITDKITVMTSAEETSMELQLHPASLGNVNILLTSSKDGITAKFTAQNEIVKEAVESQMTQLMQKFDEQGVKVTSIEITIASHAFEQNLEQNDNGESARDQMERNKKSLRRINLTEIDEEIEEGMSEAELIAAQMMAYNGNMIDFSA